MFSFVNTEIIRSMIHVAPSMCKALHRHYLQSFQPCFHFSCEELEATVNYLVCPWASVSIFPLLPNITSGIPCEQREFPATEKGQKQNPGLSTTSARSLGLYTHLLHNCQQLSSSVSLCLSGFSREQYL